MADEAASAPSKKDVIATTINGQEHTLDVPMAMPILWVLRDVVTLTGTKYGCGKGLCGACTIHLDGQAVRSCVTPISAAKNKSITTIEGLSPDGTHPLQLAWNELNVAQCGYCQAGQIMNAAAWLQNSVNVSDEDIDQQQSGNLCRCATYPRIRAAIKRAVDLKNGSKS